jgi:hypothetical protein
MISNGATADAATFNAAYASKSAANTLTGVQTFDEEIIMKQNATPSNPASNYNKLYFKSDNNLYKLTSGGTETAITATAPNLTFTVTAIKTTTYTAAVGELVRVNGASAFTVNFPSAVGLDGQMIRVYRTDQTLANAVTVDFNSTETGNGATTVTLNTQYELYEFTSDGTNWIISMHTIPSLWTSYTPTFTGFGTVTIVDSNDCQWKRDGSDLLLRIKATSGTPTATEARVSIPSGLTSGGSSLIPSIQMAGSWTYNVAVSAFSTVLIEQSVSYVTFGIQTGSAGGLTKQNANAFISSTNTLCFQCRIPIAGWLE